MKKDSWSKVESYFKLLRWFPWKSVIALPSVKIFDRTDFERKSRLCSAVPLAATFWHGVNSERSLNLSRPSQSLCVSWAAITGLGSHLPPRRHSALENIARLDHQRRVPTLTSCVLCFFVSLYSAFFLILSLYSAFFFYSFFVSFYSFFAFWLVSSSSESIFYLRSIVFNTRL